jgi:hypothetical protein
VIRRITKHANLSTYGLNNDEENVRAVVDCVARFAPDPHDRIAITDPFGRTVRPADRATAVTPWWWRWS